MKRSQFLALGSAAVLVAVVPTVSAQAGGGGRGGHAGHEVIEVEDDCHPPTFNTEIVPGVEFCDPEFDGDTTASEFFEEIAEDREVGEWRFHPDDTEIDRGERLLVKNIGGELHTFTPVERFGGGCVPDPRLDIGEPPVEECAGFDPAAPQTHPTAVLPGQQKVFDQDERLQRYECLIHPWMRAVVEVDD